MEWLKSECYEGENKSIDIGGENGFLITYRGGKTIRINPKSTEKDSDYPASIENIQSKNDDILFLYTAESMILPSVHYYGHGHAQKEIILGQTHSVGTYRLWEEFSLFFSLVESSTVWITKAKFTP